MVIVLLVLFNGLVDELGGEWLGNDGVLVIICVVDG